MLDLRESFLRAQRVNVNDKCKIAAGIISAAVLSACAAGVSPIPVSDALILPGIEAVMVGALATVFGVTISAIIPVVAGQILASSVGLGTASLIKLIPIVGTVIGGVIDAALAGILTAAIGILYPS